MAVIKPFRAVRPREDLASKIAALPYDVYNREEAKKEVQREPESFLQIDRAETMCKEGINLYSEEVYQKAHDLLWKKIQNGIFIQDEKPCYYLYELIMGNRSQTGIVACASIDDYENGIIKKHECTRAEKEQDRICHVDACDAQTGPIFLAYRKNEELKQIIKEVKEEKNLFDFQTRDGIIHRGWKIAEKDRIDRIEKLFEKTKQIYIADGHHRAASAVKVGLKRRKEHPDYTGKEEFNFFLSVLFSEEELLIMDYNRVVKELNGYKKEEFLKKVEEKFTVISSENMVKPEHKGEMGMDLEGEWYLLRTKEEYKNDDPVEGLDVSYLQRELLSPVLGIEDPKTDKRISFVGGIRGIEELEKRVNKDCKVAFSMYPTTIQELFEVADAGRLMPPKSTWFEPKLRSGLFLHLIGEEKEDSLRTKSR